LVLNFICVGYLQLLFFRSERKMVDPNVEFTTKESRVVMKSLFLKETRSNEIYDEMSVTYGNKVHPARQLQTGLLNLRQDISTVRWRLSRKATCG